MASAFGTRVRPDVIVTAANVTPFVWWIFGRTVIVVPETAIQNLEASELRLLIAHEIAHIKRRDHYFRWVEWAAMILFWWNPVVWWARRELRISEELACDEVVLEATRESKSYAQSLLNMAELLITSEIRPPIVASAFNSGGNLENRLKTIIAEKTHYIPTRLRTAILAVAACIFPLGLVYAQDFEAVERRLGLAVHEGELSLEKAQVMMEALRRSSQHTDREHHADVRQVDQEGIARRIAGALFEAGVEREAIRPTIGIIRRIAGQIAEEGNRFELGEDANMYLRDELGLNRDQVTVVVEIAEKLADTSAREHENQDDGERDLRGIIMRIKAAVERGELSEKEAEIKMLEIRKKMSDEFGASSSQRREFEGIMMRIKSAVETGEISEEEAREKIEAFRRELADDENRENADLADRKRRYMGILERVKAAVQRGELSEDEAERKIVELRKEMFGDDDDDEYDERVDNGETEERKDRYMAVERRIKAAVERGDMSEAEAERKLIEVRKELFGDDDD